MCARIGHCRGCAATGMQNSRTRRAGRTSLRRASRRQRRRRRRTRTRRPGAAAGPPGPADARRTPRSRTRCSPAGLRTEEEGGGKPSQGGRRAGPGGREEPDSAPGHAPQRPISRRDCSVEAEGGREAPGVAAVIPLAPARRARRQEEGHSRGSERYQLSGQVDEAPSISRLLRLWPCMNSRAA